MADLDAAACGAAARGLRVACGLAYDAAFAAAASATAHLVSARALHADAKRLLSALLPTGLAVLVG